MSGEAPAPVAPTPTGDNLLDTYNLLRYKGLSRIVSIGIVANIQHESNGVPWIAEWGYESQWGWGVPSTRLRGWGLCQWTWDRHRQVRQFVTGKLGTQYYTSQFSLPKADTWMTKNDVWKLRDAMLDFMLTELNGAYKTRALDPMMAAKTPEDAAEIFVRKFEVPGDMENAVRRRRATATELARRFV